MSLVERRPSGREWLEVRNPAAPVGSWVLACSTWSDGRLFVISTLVDAELPDGSGATGLQWHVSISRGKGKRAKPLEIRRALRAFDFVSAEEDNHEPGAARHFWMPVDPSRRVDCECKETEDVITDRDGFKWSNPKDPSECRGCQYARMFGKPCPIHASEANP